MCHGTYVLSYTCGHVHSTPNICLRAIDAHYRCEPRGMKITQPAGRCVECYARDLEPQSDDEGRRGLATSVRFNPFPFVVEDGERRERAGSAQVRAILRW